MRLGVSFETGGVPGLPAVHVDGLEAVGFDGLPVADDQFADLVLKNPDPALRGV